MGVYIRGMEMPKRCWDCEFEAPTIDHHECCILTKKSYNWGLTTRPSDCPLVSVPPHGRLIDADALDKLFEDQWHYLQVLDWNENPTAEATQSGINWCINTMHDDAPTIIPAEEGE